MKKFLKISLITLMSFILLLIATLTIVVNVVDPNQYKSQITKSVQVATGRQLNIAGKIEWSLFPWLSLKINDVSFANAPGFGETPFLSVKMAKASIKLLPILMKKLEVGTLTLDNAQINLARNSSGINNWDDLVKSKAQPETPTSNLPTHATSKEKFVFSIDNVQINQASLSWNNEQTPQNFVVSDLDVLATNIRLGDAFAISLRAQVLDKIKNITLKTSLSGKININQDLNQFDVESLEAKVNNFELTGNVSAQKTNENLNFKGDLSIPSFDLKQFAAGLGTTLPATQNPSTFKSFSLKTHFSGTDKALNIEALAIKLDTLNLNGKASVNNFAAPAIRFELAADQINLDDYMPPASANAGKAPQAKSVTDNNQASDTQNSYAALRKLDIHGTFSLAKFMAMKLTTSDASLILDIKNGLIQLQNLQAKLYEGNLLSNASYDVRSNTPKINFKGALSDVQLQPLLKDFMNKEVASGKGNINIDITTQGTTPAAMTRALNGNLNFLVANGQLNNIDLAYQVERLKALAAKQSPPSEPAVQATRFDKLSASAKIINGIINNNDFILESNNLLTAKGMGTMDLPNQTINYAIKVKALNAGDVSNYDIPINIKGSLMSPSITPDMTSIVKQLATQNAGNLAKQFLGGQGNSQSSKSQGKDGDLQQKAQQAVAEQGQKLLGGLFK